MQHATPPAPASLEEVHDAGLAGQRTGRTSQQNCPTRV
jgi:hypothetical protein